MSVRGDAWCASRAGPFASAPPRVSPSRRVRVRQASIPARASPGLLLRSCAVTRSPLAPKRATKGRCVDAFLGAFWRFRRGRKAEGRRRRGRGRGLRTGVAAPGSALSDGGYPYAVISHDRVLTTSSASSIVSGHATGRAGPLGSTARANVHVVRRERTLRASVAHALV